MEKATMNNIKINKENESVELLFNSKFYTKEAICEASEAFSEILTSKVEDDELRVTLSDIDKEVELDTIGYEFFNYVFGIMKNNS